MSGQGCEHQRDAAEHPRPKRDDDAEEPAAGGRGGEQWCPADRSTSGGPGLRRAREQHEGDRREDQVHQVGQQLRRRRPLGEGPG
uniref:hypothetical protein n=1 Tax=Arthrobacter sp. H14 TaxID=1312959 RepID=UPI0012DCD0DD